MQDIKFEGLFVDDVHVWRGQRHVLAGLCLTLAAGEVAHVAGANGVGKTTLLRVAAGLAQPEEGEVRWNGRPIRGQREQFGAALAYLGHEPALKAELTARENLAYAVRVRRRATARALDDALECVGLADCADVLARGLSAGQRRRVALARVLLSGARLWILDEPYTNLDAAGHGLVGDLVAEHARSHGLALLAAHQAVSIPGCAVRKVQLS